ncbi:hypothetical protein GCM10018954_034310 [Kutzneria kofuensis]
MLPDLPVQHAGPWREAADKRELASVFIAAPSSTDQRLAAIARASTGFVYAASTLGVTGMRSEVSGAELVARIRQVTELPVLVGLGVSEPAGGGGGRLRRRRDRRLGDRAADARRAGHRHRHRRDPRTVR